ncbi:MAG: hypothetical protein HY869_10770 [Chloroflexi bacterium]|nr:hypothetical protein [Chloroflexota bacterium]
MLRKTLPVLLLLALLAACAPQAASPAPDQPTNNETPTSPDAVDYLPQPADSALTRDGASLDSYQLLTLESYPLQFNLTLTGSLPTPCHQLRVAVSPPNAGNKIAVEVYSVVDPNAVCAQVIQPFEVSVPLGSFPSGHYFLHINGNQATEFDA